MPADQWGPGNPDLALLIEIGFVVLCAVFIWRLALVRPMTPGVVLAIALFTFGLVCSIWAVALNIGDR